MFNILLIDVGEIFEIQFYDYQLFALSKKDQEIPPQCTYCILDKVCVTSFWKMVPEYII